MREPAGDGHRGVTEHTPPTFDLTVPIDRPPEAVFAFLSDVQDAEPIPRSASVRMVKDPAGPTAVGTRWHEQVRLVPGCWLHVESVVTQVDEPRRLGMDFRTRWFTGHLDYEVEGVGAACVLHQRETLVMRWPLRWLAPALKRQLERHLVQRLQDIRVLLEAPA